MAAARMGQGRGCSAKADSLRACGPKRFVWPHPIQSGGKPPALQHEALVRGVRVACHRFGLGGIVGERFGQHLTSCDAIEMRPAEIQQIGDQLAIKWEDGTESFIPLETMRRRCPCASCHGETDILGNVYKGPARELSG